jgi:hypothetical protein
MMDALLGAISASHQTGSEVLRRDGGKRRVTLTFHTRDDASRKRGVGEIFSLEDAPKNLVTLHTFVLFA